MFEKGHYVICGSNGICKVEDISTLSMDGVSRNRVYYILKPIASKGSTVYLPVDNTSVITRSVISREEAVELIDSMPEIPVLKIENEKTREEKYKELMRQNDCRAWICMTKTLYLRKKERLAKKLKNTNTDEKYFALAEGQLYSELGIALDMTKDEVKDYIQSRLEECVTTG